MNYKTVLVTISFVLFLSSCAEPQEKLVGGPCEGCEAIYEYGDKKLSPVDTLPGFSEASIKLKITGVVFHNDGKTPAKDVILYIYQTNKEGVYPKQGGETGWAQRHGYIRGWIRTNEEGKYTFYTLRPGSYPNRSDPEHIHVIVKEPGINEHYLDDFLFNDDPKLIKTYRERLENRGGPGIVQPEKDNGIYLVKRDIILGLNIPGYK